MLGNHPSCGKSCPSLGASLRSFRSSGPLSERARGAASKFATAVRNRNEISPKGKRLAMNSYDMSTVSQNSPTIGVCQVPLCLITSKHD